MLNLHVKNDNTKNSRVEIEQQFNCQLNDTFKQYST